MNTTNFNSSKEQEESLINSTVELIKEYIKFQFPTKDIIVTDLHTSVFQYLLKENCDIQDENYRNKLACIDLLKLLTDPVAKTKMTDTSIEWAVEMLSGMHSMCEHLEWDFTRAMMHLTLVEQFGSSDIKVVKRYQKSYVKKLSIAKYEKQLKEELELELC